MSIGASTDDAPGARPANVDPRPYLFRNVYNRGALPLRAKPALAAATLCCECYRSLDSLEKEGHKGKERSRRNKIQVVIKNWIQ